MGGRQPAVGVTSAPKREPSHHFTIVVILLSVFFGNGSIADSFALVFSGVGNVRIVHPYYYWVAVRVPVLYPVPGCVIDPDLTIFHFFTNCSQFYAGS